MTGMTIVNVIFPSAWPPDPLQPDGRDQHHCNQVFPSSLSILSHIVELTAIVVVTLIMILVAPTLPENQQSHPHSQLFFSCLALSFDRRYFNNTHRHLGQMAQWTGLMVYDTDPY